MRPHRRLAPLALLSALTLTHACTQPEKKEEPAKTQPSGGDSKTTTTAEPTNVKAPEPLPTTSTPTTDSRPVADIGAVVATVQVPTGTAMTDLAAAVDNMKPGASALLKMQAPSALSQMLGMDLAGAKLSGSISLVIVDPIAHPKPFALLVEVENLDVLTENAKNSNTEIRSKDGKALLGPADVVAAAESFAFANLGAPLDHSEIVIYPKPLMVALRPKIDEGLAAMKTQLDAMPGGANMAQFFDVYLKGLMAMTDQTDRVVISLAASTSSTDLYFRMYPTKGTSLEAFTQAQTPGDHSLLAKLPSGFQPPALMSGTMRAGAARDALMGWMVEFMRSMYRSDLSTEEWAKVLTTWLDTFDGNFSVAIEMGLGGTKPGMRMTGLMGSTDAAAMRTAWREMIVGMTKSGGTMEMLGMKVSMTHQPDALEHDGVAVDLFTSKIDASGMPPEQQAALAAAGSGDQSIHFAAFDQFGAMATAEDDGAPMKALIDAARGKGSTYQPSATIQAALDSSKQHGESLVYYIDFKSLMASMPTPTPIEMPFTAVVMGLGKAGEGLSMRISLLK